MPPSWSLLLRALSETCTPVACLISLCRALAVFLLALQWSTQQSRCWVDALLESCAVFFGHLVSSLCSWDCAGRQSWTTSAIGPGCRNHFLSPGHLQNTKLEKKEHKRLRPPDENPFSFWGLWQHTVQTLNSVFKDEPISLKSDLYEV